MDSTTTIKIIKTSGQSDEIETTTTLHLNTMEASWLKGLVQNCLLGNPEEEPPLEKRIRESFYNALKDVEY